MQNKSDGILRAINNKSGKYNILTFPTHEPWESGLSPLPHTFYLFQAKGIRTWNHQCRPLPKNHILLDGTPDQIKPDIKIDIVWSQNKWGQFEIAQRIATHLNLPLISLEHTLPMKEWSKSQLASMTNMRGKLNVFITEYSAKQWGYDLNDPSVRVIKHGIDTETFKPDPNAFRDNRVLTVVNDFVNRDYFCGWSLYQRLIKGFNPNPLGNTPGFSEGTKSIEELVYNYQHCGIFLNSSIVSPVPTSLLEAMSCGCPVVTTATCAIPEFVQDGVNGFCSNDENYLREKIQWCLDNPFEAMEMGLRARDTIVEKYQQSRFVSDWAKIFDECYGRGY